MLEAHQSARRRHAVRQAASGNCDRACGRDGGNGPGAQCRRRGTDGHRQPTIRGHDNATVRGCRAQVGTHRQDLARIGRRVGEILHIGGHVRRHRHLTIGHIVDERVLVPHGRARDVGQMIGHRRDDVRRAGPDERRDDRVTEVGILGVESLDEAGVVPVAGPGIDRILVQRSVPLIEHQTVRDGRRNGGESRSERVAIRTAIGGGAERCTAARQNQRSRNQRGRSDDGAVVHNTTPRLIRPACARFGPVPKTTGHE